MNEEKLKQINQKIDLLEQKYIEAKIEVGAKDEIIRRLDAEFRAVKEIAVMAQRDPKTIDNLLSTLEKISDKDFPFPKTFKLENFDRLEKVFMEIKESLSTPKESIKISNLAEIRPPKEIGLIGLNSLIKGFHSGFLGVLDGIKEIGNKVFKANVTGEVRVSNKELADAIPVRLASSDLRYFYNAMATVMGSGGPGQDTTFLQQILAALSNTGATAVGDNTKTLTSAGTSEQLPNVPCKKVIIQAHESNNGTVVIGGSTVVGAVSGRRGYAIFPTQSQVFEVSNLNLLYWDGTNTGDKIHYYYEV